MLGSFPCYPGIGNRAEYKGRHFYCSLCSEVVSPCFVDVVVVDSQGTSTEILKVLRCKRHRIQGLGPYGPITSLWALESKDQNATVVCQNMLEVCSRVRNFDICSLLSFVAGGICFLGSLALGLIVSPLGWLDQWAIPVVVAGVGLALCFLGAILAYLAKIRIRIWKNLSSEYVQHCSLRQVQQDTEKYAVLTPFPPTCSLAISPFNVSSKHVDPSQEEEPTSFS
ncbi:hypothetical protein [Chlamydia sp. 17-3921]|uniref:hypothetical protein n=1 Tax=Chlamydia sp. 17-3921 TaxID=2675798 RepID=UPI001F3640EB|nr:hypothetical protein [Chlamydia sp. 17-3921]